MYLMRDMYLIKDIEFKMPLMKDIHWQNPEQLGRAVRLKR